jgi:hypothetical protein
MAELRSRALGVKPGDIGLAAEVYSERPWGVLMETGLKDGAAYSLIVLADGTVSLYFSSGGGVIGAGQHDQVRSAGEAMLRTATRLQSHAQPTSDTPLPSPGYVNFYLLTAKGTLKYSAPEGQFGDGHDLMSELFYAGHKVIASVRQVEQARSNSGGSGNG